MTQVCPHLQTYMRVIERYSTVFRSSTVTPSLTGLLNRAEWLKFAATFFNKEPEANRFFEDVRSRFDVIVDMVTAKRLAGAASPRVAFLSAPGAYSGVYNDCPFGGYEIKVLQGYKEHLVSYGGGTSFDPAVAARWCSLTEGCSSYICPNATSMKKVRTVAQPAAAPSSLYCCLPASPCLRLHLLIRDHHVSTHRPYIVPQVLRTIDVVIDETSSATPASYTIDTFKAGFELTDGALNDAGETPADYPFLASSRVYRVDKRLSPANGGTDWMESALPHADMTLLDFAVSLVPELKDETFNHPVRGSIDLADFETRWLRNIAAGEVAAVVDPSECDDPSAVCPGDPAALSATAPVYNGCNSDFCFTAFPPLPPYSKPSPPPPMQPLGTSLVAIVAEVFEISVTAAGTVDTLDKAGYETKMRTYLGCRAPLCQVAIAVTAGSVNVVATVTDTTFTAVTAAKKLRTDSIAALSTALGVTVKATPTVSAATKTTLTVFFAAPPPPTVNTESDAGVVGGVVGGLLGAATLGLFGCVCYRYSREKQGNPVFHNMDGARAVGATVTAVGATLTSPASDTGINMEPVSHLESTGTL